jgi:glucose 1-dehydrogenase
VPVQAQRLAGRVALITGGSRGIGRAIAERFVQEGAEVGIGHRQDADRADATLAALKTIRANSPIAIDGDITSETVAEAMIAAMVVRFGRIDILVNNAGFQTETPGADFDADRFRAVIDVDLLGAAWLSRAAIRHFLARPGGGTIINTTSVHQIIPKPGYAAYAAAKAGLGHLTRTLALEFADRGIRINAVGPGAVLTDMNDAWKDDPAARAAVEAHIPMGFAASPDDIAPVFAFLASDEARYITGQTLYACGGLTLYGEFRQNWSS